MCSYTGIISYMKGIQLSKAQSMKEILTQIDKNAIHCFREMYEYSKIKILSY